MSTRTSTRAWQRHLYASDDDDDDKNIDPLVKKYAEEVQMNARDEIDSAHKNTLNKKIRLEQQKRSWRCPFQNSVTKVCCTEVRTDHRAKDSVYCRKHKPVMKKRKEREDKLKAERENARTCPGAPPPVLTLADFYLGDKSPVTPTDMEIDPPPQSTVPTKTAVAIAVPAKVPSKVPAKSPVPPPTTVINVDDDDDELERRLKSLNSNLSDYDATRLRDKRANAPANPGSSQESSNESKEEEAPKKESKEEEAPTKVSTTSPRKSPKESPKESPKKSPTKVSKNSVPIDYVAEMFRMLAENPAAFKPMMEQVMATYASKSNNNASSSEDELKDIDITAESGRTSPTKEKQDFDLDDFKTDEEKEDKDVSIDSDICPSTPELTKMLKEVGLK